MFITRRFIRLSETDATGVLYFTNLLKFSTEAFETFLESKGDRLGAKIQNGEILLPVVNARANYLSPLRLSDELETEFFVQEIRACSFELGCFFTNLTTQRPCGETRIVHAAVSKSFFKAIGLPDQLKSLLIPLLQPSRSPLKKM